MTPHISEAIEREIDRYGLASLCDTVATILNEKAAHIEENWQDAALAREWQRAARTFDTLTERFNRSPVFRVQDGAK